jgi:hypothetical protein
LVEPVVLPVLMRRQVVALRADMDLMKEKFGKLLLGEDMSGSGKGVPSALALSNAVTNLAGDWPSPVQVDRCSAETTTTLFFFFLFHPCVAYSPAAASVFGEQRKLEPMAPDRKGRWKKEVGWLLSVADHIVEFVAKKQVLDNGTEMEVRSATTCMPLLDAP